MNSITSTQGGSSPYANQAAGRGQRTGGGDPGERLEKSLTSFLTEQKVSSEDQTKIQTELKDAVATLANSTSLTPQKVKNALSEVLTEHGIDGDRFVSQLGTPGSQPQSGQTSASAEGPRGGGGPRRAGGPPPGGGPPPTSDDTETSETTETSAASEIDALLEWLEEQSGTSSTSSKAHVDTFPDSFIKRGGGNLDATT